MLNVKVLCVSWELRSGLSKLMCRASLILSYIYNHEDYLSVFAYLSFKKPFSLFQLLLIRVMQQRKLQRQVPNLESSSF